MNKRTIAAQQKPSDSLSNGGSKSTEQLLAERGARYGDFKEHAEITWAIKGAMRDTSQWHKLTPMHKEALDMIAHKIGRILNGDPNYDDNWADIAGYAKLVADRCPEQ